MSYADFEARMAQVNDLLSVLNLLAWDARTQMPSGGVVTRGQQVATITALARDLVTGDAMQRAIEGARAEVSGDPIRQRALDQAARDIGTLSRVPAELISEAAELKTVAHSAWVDARAKNDFAAYAPVLERMFAIQHKIADAIGYADHPYDAMLALYEPDMTLAQLEPTFDTLKAALVPLIERALSVPAPRQDFLSRSYPIAAQKAFGLRIAEKFGYDMNRGRLDDTIHPFEISFTRNDVRITSRWRENWLPGGFFALWHEAGHAMYEQGAAPEITRTIFATDVVNLYAVAGASFGMHESQSRLWENRVGRSCEFWELHFGALRDTFPEQLADVTAEEFWRSVNAVRPDYIRVEADELTYDLHIILRSEIEAAVMTGEAKVSDLPGLWAERMKSYLGRDVPNDTLGVLQDVHWSHGYVGSFPTYTLGNIMGAQFFDAALKESAIATGLETGDYAPLRGWLTENIYRHGRASSPAETLQRVTGGPLDTAPYIARLTDKVDALTGVSR
ncbi:carboxypeptidase M32 [Consotaella salsifontis]|uniref:Metal-dependent carboxypeptidase n=1 Tax=Consotaella salsifontis TaxID=1365950 RepID=A0A1T4Q279_9HYPH|nr:carboxypeptidase M32 [Consotaella salsifontis]SJZ97647.1 carboxypeptidase Taq [Consotaella salsifontis]